MPVGCGDKLEALQLAALFNAPGIPAEVNRSVLFKRRAVSERRAVPTSIWSAQIVASGAEIPTGHEAPQRHHVAQPGAAAAGRVRGGCAARVRQGRERRRAHPARVRRLVRRHRAGPQGLPRLRGRL
eukprot:scaffold452_cov235-Pinguiococcus_pyrenoidosus.AAC.3